MNPAESGSIQSAIPAPRNAKEPVCCQTGSFKLTFVAMPYLTWHCLHLVGPLCFLWQLLHNLWKTFLALGASAFTP